jgi:hypothetical protein
MDKEEYIVTWEKNGTPRQKIIYQFEEGPENHEERKIAQIETIRKTMAEKLLIIMATESTNANDKYSYKAYHNGELALESTFGDIERGGLLKSSADLTDKSAEPEEERQEHEHIYTGTAMINDSIIKEYESGSLKLLRKQLKKTLLKEVREIKKQIKVSETICPCFKETEEIDLMYGIEENNIILEVGYYDNQCKAWRKKIPEAQK